MFKGVKIAGFAALTAFVTLQAVPALSNTQTWDFADGSFNNNNYGNSLGLSEDGINLTVTGWSDTGDTSPTDLVETARLIWAQPTSLGIKNRDENTGSPNHSVDSDGLDSNDGGFDMLLLEFDTAVTLDGLDLTWAYDNGNSYADISILAYDSSTGSPGVSGNTWSNVLSSNGGGYQSAGNYANVSAGGVGYYGVNPTNIASTRYLIGAYNPVYGSGTGLGGGNDGFKLASVSTFTSTNPPSDVPVPGTIALFMAGILAMRARRSPAQDSPG